VVASSSNAARFVYGSCWVNDVGNRALTEASYTQSGMTVEICSTKCSAYKYFGVEYSTECYCGNALKSGTNAQESDCNMACGGASSETCGGPSRINLYSKDGSIQPLAVS
jgi:hypothetical protein